MNLILASNLHTFLNRYPKYQIRCDAVLKTDFESMFRWEQNESNCDLYENNILVDSSRPGFLPPVKPEALRAHFLVIHGFGLGSLFQQILQIQPPSTEEYFIVEPSLERFLFSLSHLEVSDLLKHPQIHWLIGLEGRDLAEFLTEILLSSLKTNQNTSFQIKTNPVIEALDRDYFDGLKRIWEMSLIFAAQVPNFKPKTHPTPPQIRAEEKTPSKAFSLTKNIHSDLEIVPSEVARLEFLGLDRNWNLRNYFGHIRVISNDPQSPRFLQCITELEKIGLTSDDYEIEKGVRGSTLPETIWSRMNSPEKYHFNADELRRMAQGQAGCYMAHYLVLKKTHDLYVKAQKKYEELKNDSTSSSENISAAANEVKRLSSVIIIEDNNGFGRVIDSRGGDQGVTLDGEGLRFRQVMKDLPEDWDMFYFMSQCGSQKINGSIARLDYGLTTKCYAVRAKMYPVLLEKLKAIEAEGVFLQPVDHEIASLHSQCKAYAPIEPLSYRFASVSEVGGKNRVGFHWQGQIEVRA